MGRTGGSLDRTFPPQGGGRSPRRVDPLVGSKAGRPLGEMIVVVVGVNVVVFVAVKVQCFL